MLNINQSNIQFYSLILSRLQKHWNKTYLFWMQIVVMQMKIWKLQMEQTTCTSTHIETMTQDKEVQVQPFIKTFKTVGTQTEHLHMQGNTKIHPDDINKLCHLEDHSYSLGPNNNSSTDDNKDTVEPCTTPCTPVTEEQLTLVECDDVQNGVIVELKKQGSS